MKIVYLYPRSSIKREFLRSDSLWGSICWGIKLLYGEEKLLEFLSNYSKSEYNKFLVSSVFPFIFADGKRKPLFPKLILPPFNWDNYFKQKTKNEKFELIKLLKQFKSVKFITEDELSSFVPGRWNELDFFNYFKENQKKYDPKLYEEVSLFHNTINRLSGSTDEGALFTSDELFFKENFGLFFLMDGDDKDIEIVVSVLRLFEHIGIMGDRTIGKGNFKYEVKDYSIPKPDNPNSKVILSLYSPTKDELQKIKGDSKSAWYEIIARKGKVGTHFFGTKDFWKDTVVFFAEGSIFPYIDKSSLGENKAVKRFGNLEVLQFGYSFNIPMRLKEYED